MQPTPHVTSDLDVALNEAEVCGLLYDDETATARVFIENMWLPDGGPVDPDGRRVLVFTGVTTLEVRLWSEEDPPEQLPLSSLDEVDMLLAEAQLVCGMYGWAFVDISDPGPRCRAAADLQLGPGPHRSGHSFDWFAEISLRTDDGFRAVLLDGTIYYDELSLARADGSPIPSTRSSPTACAGGRPSTGERAGGRTLPSSRPITSTGVRGRRRTDR
ncbi:MAG TPA: hypothetical protein VFE15_06740 [Marmoricola sp.]|jgi:hypothetical protein|nr:hypothetical protein [Marmoricola sp.]